MGAPEGPWFVTLPIIILEGLAAGFAFGAGRGLGTWVADRIRLRAEDGVPLWPLKLEDDFKRDFDPPPPPA